MTQPDDPRIQVILDMLLQLASGSLQVAAPSSERSDEIDAIITGVSMLGEELAASFDKVNESRNSLERAVQERTAELARANAQLRQELAERVRAEQELRKTQEQLIHAQKLEALGKLAGGVAHDFNNILFVILTESSLLVDALPPGHPMAADVDEIFDAAQRAARLTGQLLAFSHKQVVQPVVLDCNEVVTGLFKMLRRLVGEHIDLISALQEDLPNVRVDPGQLEQVIVNLVVNARDALPDGGTITLRTTSVPSVSPGIGLHEPALPGATVMLAVSDNGLGMDRETQARIFEPFFTTKGMGRGTGLGLSTVHDIVERSGGQIEVTSEIGAGTTFRIYLPASLEVVQAPDDEDDAPPSVRAPATILLVEDDDPVRRVIREYLSRLGYRILEAEGPMMALSVSDQHEGDIDLLITDVVMPEMSGPTLAQRLVLKRPGLKLLFMSGYSDDTLGQNGVLSPGVVFLPKPTSSKLLRQKVREALATKLH